MTIGNTTLDILTFIEANDIKFLRMQFCGLDGLSRNIAISNNQVENAIFYGIPFDASSVPGFEDAGCSDLLLKPDFKTLMVLPWRPQKGKVARVLCDVVTPDGRPYAGDSRYILKQQVERLHRLGYTMNIGAECEFFLFQLGEDGTPTMEPVDRAGYADMAPYDKGENTRREIIFTLEEMGFEIESSHHESADGQHEIDFKYSVALESADNIITFRNVVKTVAGRHGLHATFMPKPLNGQAGSGMHINLSLTKDGENLFVGAASELSEAARHFAAGVLHHVPGMTAVTNPLVNSYKRLADGMEAPQRVSWGFGDRSALIRIPAAEGEYCRMELRSPDPACNPYLAFALIIAAGLEGMEEKRALLPSIAEGGLGDPLPMTLKEAVEAMAADPLVAQVLGEDTAKRYERAKREEWQCSIRTVNPWEIDAYRMKY